MQLIAILTRNLASKNRRYYGLRGLERFGVVEERHYQTTLLTDKFAELKKTSQ